jgi:hypothetical protein
MSQRPPQDPPARRPAPRRRPPQAQPQAQRADARQASPPRQSPPRTSPPRRSPPRGIAGYDDEDALLPDEQLEPVRPSKGALVIATVVTLLAVAFLLQSGGGGSSSTAEPTFEDEVYVTRDGDTLASVGTLMSVDPSALADANGLDTSATLEPGTTLDVPDDPGTNITVPAAVAQVEDHQAIADEMARWADEYGVPPALLQGVAWEESRWDNSQVSSAGAVGIGQLVPDTADYVANDLLGEPTLSLENEGDNIRMSARYLAYLLELNEGDWGAALASYNQGPTNVRRNGWSPEATQYVTNVMAFTRGFQAEDGS